MGQSISYPQEFPLQIHRLAAFSFHQFSAIVPAPRYISSSSVSPPLFPLPSIPPSSIYPFFCSLLFIRFNAIRFRVFPSSCPRLLVAPRFFFNNSKLRQSLYLFLASDRRSIRQPFLPLPPSSLIYTTPASCAPILDYTFIPTTFFPSTHFAYKKLRCRGVEGLFFLFAFSFLLSTTNFFLPREGIRKLSSFVKVIIEWR